MKDTIVSVRMPASMLEALRQLAKKGHYLDVSEEVRSIVRSKASLRTASYSMHIKKIAQDIQTHVETKERLANKDALVKKLKSLLEELDHE